MDWARAKNVILLLLVVFNLFLGSRMISYIMERNIPAETIKNTVTILESRGVMLKCEIPRYNKDTAKLKYGSFIYDKEQISKKLLGEGSESDREILFSSDSSFIMTDGSPVDTIKDFNAKTAEAWIRSKYTEKGLIGPEYILEEKTVNSDGTISLVFNQKYKGMMVFGNYVEAIVSKNGITRLEAGYREILEFTETSELVSAYQVLLKNFDGTGNPVISSIDFGYKDIFEQGVTGLQTTEQPPVWRVKLEGEDDPRYFDATTGTEIMR